ncbi:hypothetical protein GQ43DRAFT_442674 [Delitschia confertaspora ATCC 74209]|uniref:Uncharacterized protein n=1 Tax=Delitschia confertaspora ATCC 74209 TaxID=1513339 RepID=A0A9P4MTM7_9PLEO|nr:hypothetical protein GQ43DRAFT_442674 [Delitschia confertaspora ATCC 74209]
MSRRIGEHLLPGFSIVGWARVLVKEVAPLDIRVLTIILATFNTIMSHAALLARIPFSLRLQNLCRGPNNPVPKIRKYLKLRKKEGERKDERLLILGC